MTPHCGSASLWIMSLAMTPAEREAFLAEVHVAVVTVADDDGRGPLAIRSGTTTSPAARSSW